MKSTKQDKVSDQDQRNQGCWQRKIQQRLLGRESYGKEHRRASRGREEKKVQGTGGLGRQAGRGRIETITSSGKGALSEEETKATGTPTSGSEGFAMEREGVTEGRLRRLMPSYLLEGKREKNKFAFLSDTCGRLHQGTAR